ncbi:MAG: V-type ATP synthase subunit D [Deltaproteobacteria bacterium]
MIRCERVQCADGSGFEALLARLLEALAPEARVRALGASLARASRQLHTLEQRIRPALDAEIAATTRALDERDRDDHVRLRRCARVVRDR